MRYLYITDLCKMLIRKLKIVHPEMPCDESGDKNINTCVPAGKYFSSPCMLPEFGEEEDSFEN